MEGPPARLCPAGADSDQLHPSELVQACFEYGAGALLLDEGALPPDFFDLSSGVAGELVQRVVNYGLRMATVVADPGIHSDSFRDFAREASRSGRFRFFQTRAEAVQWLGTEE